MSDQSQPNVSGGAAGRGGGSSERRAYARLSISLPGHLQLADGPKRPCLIKDVCPGGVFVEIDGVHEGSLSLDDSEFRRGDYLMLSYSTEFGGAWRKFTVGARLATALGAGIGLTFEGAPAEAIQALNELAMREQVARNERLSQRRTREPAQDQLARDLLVLCAERIEQFLQHIAPRAIDEAARLTFERAREATSNIEQNQYMEARSELEKSKVELVRNFVEHVVERVRRLPEDGGQPTEKTFEQMDGDGLSLVDTGSFDEWVAIKNMVSRAEPKFRTASATLDAQASFLAGVPIEPGDNPLGLASLSFAFHEAMQRVARTARARQALVETFESTILPDLKALYTDLEKMFESRGVKPKPLAATQAVRRTPARPAPAPGDPQHRDETSAGAMVPDAGSSSAATSGQPQTGTFPAYPSGQASSATGTFQAVPPDGAPATGTFQAIPPDGAPATGTFQAIPSEGAPATGTFQAIQPSVSQPGGGARSAVGGGPLTFQYPTGVAPVPLGSAIGAAQNLLSFARDPERARQAGSSAPSAAGPALAPGYVARPPQAKAALMGALAELQDSSIVGETTLFEDAESVGAKPGTGSLGTTGTFSRGIRNLGATGTIASTTTGGAGVARHAAAFATLDLSARLNRALESRGVALDESESDSVEVISRLIDSVVADPLVGANVKHRVRRLAVPLLKLALEDENLFVDQAHPARQVMNRLGALELPSAREGEDGASLREDVDPLIERVAMSETGSAQAFSEVLPALDALLEAQTKNYNENVARVVQVREKQAQFTREARTKDPTRARRATQPVPPEWQRWLTRAKNIEPGDAVRIDEHGSGNPRLMRLVWKDFDDSAFQFVDGAGNKGASLSQQELAMYLRRGWAERVDDASLPVMERGVFRMLEGMHSELSEEVARDRVTGLAHRRVFEAQLARSLEATGYDEGIVVGLMDLDGFGQLNERIGKKACNNLLKQMGGVLDRHIPGERTSTRIGADDFAWLLEDETLEHAHKLADRLRRAIAASSCVWKGEEISLTVSIGLAASGPGLASGGAMVEAARVACKAAKRGGGNRVIDYGEGQIEGERARVTKDLLDAGRLVLRQQMVMPIGDDKKRKPHFEVLLGVRQDDGTVGNPVEVVLAAEQANEVRAIDHWVVENTLGWMSRNRAAVAKSGGYAINLSGQTLS
ncbi:MAG: DUF1631 family protein, partial [Gammaproteobacteria bacterium]